MSSLSVVIVGGHGKVAQRLTTLLTKSTAAHSVTSIIRTPAQEPAITALGATPLLLSLEASSPSDLANAFTAAKADVVYFIAGGGGKASEGASAAERTRKVDFEGAIKVFDGIQGIAEEESRPRLIMVSAIDVRDRSKGYPAHYNAEDKLGSKAIWQAIPGYMQAKYDADSDLVKRTAFKWTILRPGSLLDSPGTGKADIGRTHLVSPISRDDVAYILYKLATRPDAAGLAIDVVGGTKTEIDPALDAFIQKGVSDWLE